MTLSMGLRFETQTIFTTTPTSLRELGLAWGLGHGKSAQDRPARRLWHFL